MAKGKKLPRIVPVLHQDMINGQPVRFFASPLAGPDWPWHSQPEFLAALGYSERERAQMIDAWLREQPLHTRDVHTADGPTRIASQLAATMLFDFLEAQDWPVMWSLNQFIVARGRAFVKHNGHLNDADYCKVLGEAAQRFDQISGNA